MPLALHVTACTCVSDDDNDDDDDDDVLFEYGRVTNAVVGLPGTVHNTIYGKLQEKVLICLTNSELTKLNIFIRLLNSNLKDSSSTKN